MPVDTNIRIHKVVINKLKRLGFAGQSYSDLIDDLVDYAKKNIDDFNEFLDERYEEDDAE